MSPVPKSENRRLLSVLFSFRNEEDVLPELLQRMRQVLDRLQVDGEMVFINDASTDRSLEILTGAARKDPRVKIINMSRRFGVAECYFAGMAHARGDAVITMDTDLQDPPEVIPELVEKWLAGSDVVYTIRTQREGESAAKMFLTRMAYRVIRLVSNEEMPVNAGDFKLISRRVFEQLLKLNEKDPYLRGLVTWMGFKQTPVYYKREARAKGITHFPLLRSKGPVITFVFGFTSFSILPLVFFLLVGLVLTTASAACGLVLCATKLFGLASLHWGWWLAAAMAGFSGLQLIGLGTVGLYLGRVYNDVRNRPRYIIDNMIGFDPAPAHAAICSEAMPGHTQTTPSRR